MCTFYERVIDLCSDKGVSGSRACTDLGLSKSTLSDIKAGRKKGVSAETAQKFAAYFGVTVGYLLGKEEKSAPADSGKHALGGDINLTQAELDLIHKFRRLDERGRSTVINTLEHEYSALPQAARSEGVSPADNSRSILRIAARDGSYQERALSDHQVTDLQAFLDRLPDVPEGL